MVGGDSDSSALTQESGDDSVAPTPRSMVTGTDAGTEYAEDDDEGSHNSPGKIVPLRPYIRSHISCPSTVRDIEGNEEDRESYEERLNS